uniref:Uncharacterized protein n=1 Tax=Xiphophorus couchianus TaxID=32473 RepID=A0A3B5LNZ9_9TELE
MGPPSTPLPTSRFKPRHLIYSSPLKPNSLLHPRLRMSIQFKICPNWSLACRSPNHFLRSKTNLTYSSRTTPCCHMIRIYPSRDKPSSL